MIEELKQLLQTNYQYAVEAQVADNAEAEAARKAGQMPTYFDLALHLQLADTCWALEKWDEAKHWYRHNARVLMERRAWRAEHGGPEAQTEGISDWEAVTLIKVGNLESGREYLRRAITYWRQKQDSELVLTNLGLHAAQAGLPDLAPYALSIINARQQLPGGSGQAANQVRKLLHYEPAQVALLLGRWDEFQKAIKEVAEGERLIEGSPELAFPEPLQDALVDASRGLRILASLHAGEIEPEHGRKIARQAFEEAMLNFYHFSGQVDWDLYFMRLNTRLADDITAGQPLNPNPFAADWSSETG
jgi:hypothetical protein